MIIKQGKLPEVIHTEFYIDGKFTLEEIHGTYGFNGMYSRKIHLHKYPTIQVKPPKKSNFNLSLKPCIDDVLQPYHILTGNMPFDGDFITSRKPISFGLNTVISISKPNKNSNENIFFRNGDKHELFYIQDGEGILKTEYGDLTFEKEKYFLIPKGTVYKIELKSKNAFFVIFESTFPIYFPPHYINKSGQSSLMSPVFENEMILPELKSPLDKEGEYEIYTKHNNGNITCITLGHHPFDVVGFEGSLYPFAFKIESHHGISREIHTEPPMRQTFQSGDGNSYGFSICTFRSQMEGWHEKDIPAPYAHLNVDSDELMFFSSSSYIAREGTIQAGSITIHPGSIPHSPHGNAALRSTKQRGKLSNMLAVMLDTFFETLNVTDFAYEYRDKEYALSWYNLSKN